MIDDTDEQIVKAQAALADTRFTTYWLDSLEAVADKHPLQHNDQCDLLVCGLNRAPNASPSLISRGWPGMYCY